MVYYAGVADEAGSGLDRQIQATKELGWKHIELRNVDGVNVHDLSDQEFEQVVDKIAVSGLQVSCFGSTVANWSRDPQSDEDYRKSVAELKRAIPRMQKLGTRMIRGMSFTRYRDVTRYTAELEARIFEKVTTLARMCEEAGILYMHENCANYGGMSSEHTLRLIENVKSSSFRLLFDTGNPGNSIDHRRGYGTTMQDAFQFYSDVKEFIGYVHIKDGRIIAIQDREIFNKSDWTWPGEGDGKVKDIVTDLLNNGYDGGFSIEPHMATVYHEAASTSPEEVKYSNFIEYGRRLMRLVEEAKLDTSRATPGRT